jgi:hypothetical protein
MDVKEGTDIVGPFFFCASGSDRQSSHFVLENTVCAKIETS